MGNLDQRFYLKYFFREVKEDLIATIISPDQPACLFFDPGKTILISNK